MKNIFDLRKWETEIIERELKHEISRRLLNAEYNLKELEKKNEIAEIKALHSKEIQSIELAHKSEVAELTIRHNENMTFANMKHAQEVNTFREEMKLELGAKAIELEKDLAVTKKELSETVGKIMSLTCENQELKAELKSMTATALKYAEKSAEVRMIDTHIITPQILESKINVIPTCKG
jgi:hypothetical protein